MTSPEAFFDQFGTIDRYGPEVDPRDSGPVSARRFNFEWFETIEPAAEGNDFVEGLLTRGALVIVYGPSNCGKTFLVTDLSLHVALGRRWFGREVEPGLVIFVAAEGGHGIRGRVAAFRQHHHLDGERPPFAVIASSVDMRDPTADTQPLIEEIRAAGIGRGAEPVLIVIDTLSRALAGGNENASEDMGSLVRNADRLREATGAAVLFVHHSGKSEAAGSRGHSLLRAACDTEIELSRDEVSGIATARITKQREMSKADDITFRLAVTEIGTDRRGRTITSCIVEPADDAPATRSSRTALSPRLRDALDALREAVIDLGEPTTGTNMPSGLRCVALERFRERLIQRGKIEKTPAGRQAWKRLKDDLQRAGRIGIWDPYVWEVTA